MRVMRTMKWMVLVLFVTVTMAVAQQPAASAPQNSQPAAAAQPQGPPTTMDQVVDRTIQREQALIKFLAPRTPVVETYLQNLTQDTQLGPVPVDDRYFLGRMDLSDSIDRSDYLKEKGDDSM